MRCSTRSPPGASSRGAWTSRRATGRSSPRAPTDECSRTETAFTSIHGPRWRMLVIGASEIAHYLAEVASTVDFQVFVCDPREEYKSAWRAKGAQRGSTACPTTRCSPSGPTATA